MYLIATADGSKQVTRKQFFKIATAFKIPWNQLALFQKVDHTAGQNAQLAFPTITWAQVVQVLDMETGYGSMRAEESVAYINGKELKKPQLIKPIRRK